MSVHLRLDQTCLLVHLRGGGKGGKGGPDSPLDLWLQRATLPFLSMSPCSLPLITSTAGYTMGYESNTEGLWSPRHQQCAWCTLESAGDFSITNPCQQSLTCGCGVKWPCHWCQGGRWWARGLVFGLRCESTFEHWQTHTHANTHTALKASHKKWQLSRTKVLSCVVKKDGRGSWVGVWKKSLR